MDEDEQRTRPADWPRKWMREEAYWRGISSNVTSGLIVALVIWLVGLAFGYFQLPAHQQGAFVLALVLSPCSIFIYWAIKSAREEDWGVTILAIIGMFIIGIGPLLAIPQILAAFK